MQLSKKVKFLATVRNENSNADTVTFLILNELGCGKYMLPDLCSQLGLARSNFNASLIRLRRKEYIAYSSHSSMGIILWWIKQDIDDKPSYKGNAPRWVIKNNETAENEEIVLGDEELWALRNGYNAGTFKNFLFGRTKNFAEKYELVKSISQD